MGSKIFISYKYADANVKPVNGMYVSSARNYVDILQDKLEDGDNINKGEDDGEDMSSLSDSTIQSKLGDKIFDSSVTVVLISPMMKNLFEQEKEQWIPWEVSYSLRQQSRAGRTSKTNAMIAVVLPDKNGLYDYFMTERNCDGCRCTTYHTNKLFNILSSNMFNRTNPTYTECKNGTQSNLQSGDSSYIHIVKWDNFINNYTSHIITAERIRDKQNEYNMCVNLK